MNTLRNDASEDRCVEPIAVIGLDGRFAGASNLDAFWENLRSGRESVYDIDDADLRALGFDEALLKDKNYVKRRPYLEGAALFDNEFFRCNAKEAEMTDPQHRVFLECCWNALESAAYDPETYPGRIGVFGSVGLCSYRINNHQFDTAKLASDDGFQLLISNEKDFVCTWVAYKLNLRGPCMTVQCGCSSGLVAVSQACQSLWSGQSDMALAGACDIDFPQRRGHMYREGHIASPDGHCRPFDKEANGTIFGDGAGVVVLKRYRDAVRDGDHVHAILRGVAVNNDGARKAGFTAPSVDGQIAVIEQAQRMARVAPSDITYIETHGTGTAIGDPIEFEALSSVFANRSREAMCWLGGVKANIGHTNAAAGIAGLIKTILMLCHRQIPPQIHFDEPNPKIALEHSPFRISKALMDWSSFGPRMAGVSSFGIGGTNAHVIVEEAREISEPRCGSEREERPPAELLLLSARTEGALRTMVDQAAAHLEKKRALRLSDVAFTLQHGRRGHPLRAHVVASSIAEAASALRNLRVASSRQSGAIVFLFTGQGAQAPGMATALYRREQLFRRCIEECADEVQSLCGLDLREFLLGNPDDPTLQHRMSATCVAQPALFALEYAAAQLFLDWGCAPAAMLGHSLGEVTAAAISNVVSLKDAIRWVVRRGELMQSMPEGRMVSVFAEPDAISAILPPSGTIAASNASDIHVVSVPVAELAALEQALTARHMQYTLLKTAHAFHSEMMSPILDEFRAVIAKLTLNKPTIPFVSNVSGRLITDEEATSPDYWAMQIRRPVRFADGVSLLWETFRPAFLELGPGRALCHLVEHNLKGKVPNAIGVVPSRRASHDAERVLLDGLGALWCSGVSLPWARIFKRQGARIPWPTYPFERKPFLKQPKRSWEAPASRQGEGTHLYGCGWRPELVADRSKDAEDLPTWLVFANEDAVGDALCRRLIAQGKKVVRVRPSQSYESDGDRFGILPGSRDDMSRLWGALTNSGRRPDVMVHLWTLPDGELDSARETPESIAERGFYTLWAMAHALRSEAGFRARMVLVTHGIQSMAGEAAVSPLKALVLGPCVSLPQELETLTMRTLDISPSDLLDHLDACLSFMAEPSAEPLGLFRSDRFWVPTYHAVTHVPSRRTKLRDHGTYVVSGGLGGIGWEWAKHVARKHRANLVLLTRRDFPTDERCTTADAWSRTKLREMRELEALGARFLVQKADVCVEKDVQRAFDEACSRFGTVHGVLHAAGLPGDTVFCLKEKHAVASVLGAKVKGTNHLGQCLRNCQADFFVLCSALATLLGGYGNSDYAAGNWYLNSFAEFYEQSTGIPTTSIMWDLWEGVGMGEHIQRNVPAFGRAEGIEVLDDVLSAHWGNQVVATKLELNKILRALRHAPEEVFASLYPTAVSPRHEVPEEVRHRAGLRPPENEVEREVAKLWTDLLGEREIGLDDNFFGLGGNSLLMIQMLGRVRDSFYVSLRLEDIYACENLEQLSALIATSMLEALEGGADGSVAGVVPQTEETVQADQPAERPR